MLLAFRTNRAFDRYWQGAQHWTTLATQIRNLSRLLWNSVKTPTPEGRQEKLQIMKLLLGVAIATKHALRGENARYKDEFIRLLPQRLESQSYRSSLVCVDNKGAVAESLTSKTNDLKQVQPLLRGDSDASFLSNRAAARGGNKGSPLSPFFTPRKSALFRRKRSATIQHVQTQTSGLVINVPLDVIHRISAYIRRTRQENLIDPEDTPSINSAVASMIDAVTKFEQILDPAHQQILLLYFLALPVQLVRQLGWALVFVTFVAAFAYFGADAIAEEIEHPFGTDQNDLPIDYYCEKLREDIEYIMESRLDLEDSDVSDDSPDTNEDFTKGYKSKKAL
ncbi:hypothetical protein HK104_009834 [Borealophlyctis nickersoniae]|nr:hypothetical protein HK104_009834 [Borealophlyctis nickersoniae]